MQGRCVGMGMWNDSLLFRIEERVWSYFGRDNTVLAVGTQDLKLVHADLKEAMVEAQDPQL